MLNRKTAIILACTALIAGPSIAGQAPVDLASTRRAASELTPASVRHYALLASGVQQSSLGSTPEARFEDTSKPNEPLIQKAIAGDAFAQRTLGDFYHQRSSIYTEEILSAQSWWIKAAAGGQDGALYSLAWLYRYGHGPIKIDLQKAEKYLQDAVRAGNTIATRDLAEDYLFGVNGRPLDPVKAKSLLLQASEGGDRYAQLRLARVITTRTGGVSGSEAEAFRWYLAAAKRNVPMAQYFVGLAYAGAIGTSADLSTAEYWLTRAASIGDQGATSALAAVRQDIAAAASRPALQARNSVRPVEQTRPAANWDDPFNTHAGPGSGSLQPPATYRNERTIREGLRREACVNRREC